MLKVHTLKTLPNYFDGVITRRKTAEVRINDRNFQVGDLLKLVEYSNGFYSGCYAVVRITDILDNFEGLKKGFVMLSFEFLYWDSDGMSVAESEYMDNLYEV